MGMFALFSVRQGKTRLQLEADLIEITSQRDWARRIIAEQAQATRDRVLALESEIETVRSELEVARRTIVTQGHTDSSELDEVCRERDQYALFATNFLSALMEIADDPTTPSNGTAKRYKRIASQAVDVWMNGAGQVEAGQ